VLGALSGSGRYLSYRFNNHVGLSVALVVSLLAHLAVFCLLDSKGGLQAQRLGVTQASFRVALQSPVAKDAASLVPLALPGAPEEIAGDQQSMSVNPYVSPDALTRSPSLLDNVELSLPDELLFSGKLTLRLYIGTDGLVDRVEVVESHLPPAYGTLAEQAFAERRFSPGRIGNKAVPTYTELEIEFNPPE
jgi:hypothetical protein